MKFTNPNRKEKIYSIIYITLICIKLEEALMDFQ